MTSPHAFNGALSPVLTPFNEDGSPSTERFIRHCRALLNDDVGLAVFGTNSEANSLNVAEKRGLLDALLEAGLPAARMMPGTGACALPDTIELTRHAIANGCAGVLMLPPFYYKGVSDEGLFRAYASVIEAIGDARLKIYLYHIPPVAQVGLSLSLIERLLNAYPNSIAGIKDSSGDWSNTAALIDAFSSSGFEVFAGSETFLLRTLQAGGAPCISARSIVNAAARPAPAPDAQAADAPAPHRRLAPPRAAIQPSQMTPRTRPPTASQAADHGKASRPDTHVDRD